MLLEDKFKITGMLMLCDRELRDRTVSSRFPVRLVWCRVVLPDVHEPSPNGAGRADVSQLRCSAAHHRD